MTTLGHIPRIWGCMYGGETQESAFFSTSGDTDVGGLYGLQF